MRDEIIKDSNKRDMKQKLKSINHHNSLKHQLN